MPALLQPQQIQALAAQGNENGTAFGELKIPPVSNQVAFRCRLMKADLTSTPALPPKLRLHYSGFLGNAGRIVIACRCRFVRNLMLFPKPGTQIDETAAIAAERPVHRSRGPFHLAPASRSFYD